jgi:3-methyladenine DNA glycosylase Tag
LTEPVRCWETSDPLYVLPATTPESAALSKLLKKHGFRFVGPTTVYAAMQACGVVNDHVAGCHVRAEVERLHLLDMSGV